MEEKLWLVDEHDQPVGEGWQWRSSDPAVNWQNFRVINAFIKNRKGELWIPRRTATKRMFPLCLDVSVGGHVEFGESYETTFARETREELNLDVTRAPCVHKGYFSPFEHGLSAWMHVWEIHMDEVPPYNTGDFVEWYWLTPKAFREHMDTGDTAKGDLLRLINILYPEV